ncbi:hypoxanthine-guanine phosphoribosyltransferase [Marinihelvus fidelis]|uniref:Hypoxanthine-guanine phosphoribosyltransferase n=1 Tax=Marinihelvus fidelis TaxID=2613842 RepID=A0A5N0TF69_9GAMM|nr:hypoxanthine-guanine phosphoribosyltransferase [Marinihelvus fidelis]KAA9133261.1 hypoxanthine-guanine phosphoribosyltransferase [Marinihelvus fidelis]
MGLTDNGRHPNPVALLESADVVHDREAVSAAMDALGAAVNAHYGDRPIVLIGVMTGAILPMAWLATRLAMPVVMDFVHATRYRGGLHGDELEYRVPPRMALDGKDVLVVDDIFDEGHTLAAIRGSLEKRGAATVKTAVLARKLHDRGLDREWCDFVGLDVPDRYVFGCGMDAYEEWRQLDRIMALAED